MIFTDLLVVELASVLAGPTVGQFFAELGAKVIKIENQTSGGDVTRKWLLPQEKNNPSAYFLSANYGKESVFLNLTSVEDREKLNTWLQHADIVIMNFKPGDAEKLKVSYSDLKKIKSDIIVGEITGYGESSARTGYDAIVQAEAGFMYLNRKPEDKPLKMPVALMDLMAAHQLKEGLLLALYKKSKSGKGSRVQVSLIQSALSSLANQGTAWLCADQDPQPLGSDHPSITPYGTVFQTLDQKYILLAVGSDREFLNLCQVLNILEISSNESYQTNPSRVKNKNSLLPILEKAILNRNRDELLADLQKYKVPAAAVYSVSEALSQPYAQHLILKNEEGQAIGLSTIAFKMD